MLSKFLGVLSLGTLFVLVMAFMVFITLGMFGLIMDVDLTMSPQ